MRRRVELCVLLLLVVVCSGSNSNRISSTNRNASHYRNTNVRPTKNCTITDPKSKKDVCYGCYTLPFSDFPEYGIPALISPSTFPSYAERTTLVRSYISFPLTPQVWYNLVRMDPQHYKTAWLAPRISDASANNIFVSNAT
jgi:hypothetical protein